MSARVARGLPLAGLSVAMDPRTPGSMPPVCPRLGNPARGLASAPCFCRWDHPLYPATTPLHPLNARGLPSRCRANLLVKRPRLN
jgi:hypothetical protein